jgi:hypothetical protein
LNLENKKKRAPYLGKSTATYYRKYGPSGKYTKAASGSLPLTQFFAPVSVDLNVNETIEHNNLNIRDDASRTDINSVEETMDDNVESDNDENISGDDDENISDDDDNISDDDDENIVSDDDENISSDDNEFDLNKLKKLQQVLKSNKKNQTAYDYLRHLAVYKYFTYLQQDNLGKMEASAQAAQDVYQKGSYTATLIRKWAKYWYENDTLPKSMQGCHQKTKSFIDDEDIINHSLSFIRKKAGKITPKEYRQYIVSVIFPQLEIPEKSISLQTSRIWLKKLGLKPQSRKKGVYFDGHEREDVLKYREVFLKEMKELESLMPTFVGDDMIQINPEISVEKPLHILVTHDECLFYSNDDRPIVWAPIGEPPLRKKGQGKSIMVSDFLLETIGRLKLTPEQILANPNIPTEARKYLKPGKNAEGWWTADHLIDQVINYAIPIFEITHPGAIAVMAFDNSTNHGAMPTDGLNAATMNVNPGGKQPCMHSTYFGPENIPQSMIFPSNHSTYPNQPKGMRQVLIERGLWKDGLIGDCKLCKGKDTKVIDLQRVDCCMRHILSLQPDFLAQKSKLQVEIEKCGHKCIFYPKYHCELNYIEMYWSAAKQYTREHCNYTWAGLQKTVPEALDSVSLITIRRFAQKSWRYMDIYRKGITGKLAEFAAKKYKSHRRVPDSIYYELNLDTTNI